MWKEKEYLELLELNGIDTVCFMGSGYDFEDYRVGQEFYFSYAFMALDAKLERGFNTYHAKQVSINYYNIDITDRFKIIKKYEFRKNIFYGNKMRLEKCLIQNLRTKEITHLKDKEVDRLYWCLMAEPK
jgi:hypothetical protein